MAEDLYVDPCGAHTERLSDCGSAVCYGVHVRLTHNRSGATWQTVIYDEPLARFRGLCGQARGESEVTWPAVEPEVKGPVLYNPELLKNIPFEFTRAHSGTSCDMPPKFDIELPMFIWMPSPGRLLKGYGAHDASKIFKR